MADVPDVRAVVVETIRLVAHWMPSGDPYDVLCDAATAVENWAGPDGFCCPLCEEVECDGDCPLRHMRAGEAATTLRHPFEVNSRGNCLDCGGGRHDMSHTPREY